MKVEAYRSGWNDGYEAATESGTDAEPSGGWACWAIEAIGSKALARLISNGDLGLHFEAACRLYEAGASEGARLGAGDAPSAHRRDVDGPADGYEYETDSRLPDGWTVAVWPDGRALVCSPGTCPEELCGHTPATSADAAVREALADPIIAAMLEEV